MTAGKIEDNGSKYKLFPEVLLSIAQGFIKKRVSELNEAGKRVQEAAQMAEYFFLQKKEELKKNKEQVINLIKYRSERLPSALHEHDELIKLLMRNINEVFWIADSGLTKTFYVSPGYETVMGLSCESLYDNPRSFLNAIHPDDKGRLLSDMEVMKKGLPFSHDYRVVHPDMSVRWIWSRGFPDSKDGLSVYVGIVEDITERKRMEYDLIAQRNKMKTIIDAMQDYITIQDLEYNITFQCESLKSIFGNRLGEKCYCVYERNESVCEGCPIELSYKDGKPHMSLRKVQLPNGEIRYSEVTANPIRDADGNIVSCLEIVKNVTADYEAAEAVRASEEKYRNLLNGAGDAIVIVGLDGCIIDANKKAEELLARAKDEIAGMFYELLMSDKEIERTRNAFENTIMSGSGLLLNVQIKSADDAFIPVDINASVVEYGGRKVIQAIARDIRKRLELEKHIATEHAFRKAIEDCAVAGIAAVNLEGRLIYANPSFCKMVGYSEDELLGSLPPFKHWAPEDAANINSTLKAVLSGQMLPEGTDVIYKRKNNERINVNIRNSRLFNAEGEITGVLGSMVDITSRKAMENELKEKTEILTELNYNLMELVNTKVYEIRCKDQLLLQQSKMAAMGEMISAIAHQWRQPLNSLGLIVQDIKDAYEYGELDAAYIDSTVKNSLKQLDFMSSTIDVFRSFFKPSQEKETFDIIEVSSEVFSMISSQLKTNSIAYRISCHIHNRTFLDFSEVVPCEATVITTYKSQLAHVLLNLINNAKDAIVQRREHGFLLEEGMISVDCYKEGGILRVEVSDNGGGIPQEIIEKIFDQYFTTKSEKGTGIGLYMSKVIVEESLGGKIYASTKDSGSVFTIELYV
ncbi:PAS domain-containing sensor histidine kinase [Candidatus Magnetominusculus xianensis]|uniref:histidine kinase n=1 Tax=Candidatus Magnetominusculus xianensis TaxID=1748249 RepID=A0ABR5SED1_9BACT|nr:PAS domain S-box protein [Candidatus Magnetominusculus xianensis]KWT84140.1 multi-sensor signal transduction histidine kinase [Candidatus Magnetominusculus xianensis]MBF0402432.1 PAS domain S-box protein [Nitrospirota bacterium]